MIRYYTEKEYEAEVAHRKVNKTLNRLDRLSGKVALGFVVFWIVYIAAWVLTFVYFFG
jgi:hypothetical protein